MKMNIEETKHKVDHLLSDRGLVKEHKEQAVRQLLYHLYVAIDIYRYMTFAEKSKAGYWFRMFKGSFSLTGFLKERKRKREKKKSPLHPSNKETEPEEKEKDEKTLSQAAFWAECRQYVGKYGEDTVAKFYCYWAEEDKQTGKMLWETRKSWNTRLRLAAWSRKGYEAADKTAALRLQRLQNKGNPASAADSAEQRALAAEREAADARRERELAESRKNSISLEEYVRTHPDSQLARQFCKKGGAT